MSKCKNFIHSFYHGSKPEKLKKSVARSDHILITLKKKHADFLNRFFRIFYKCAEPLSTAIIVIALM